MVLGETLYYNPQFENAKAGGEKGQTKFHAKPQRRKGNRKEAVIERVFP
jgi:hypothetical protein